jgi:anti-sigma factor RsiW
MTNMHDQITDRLSEYLDGELTDTERSAVDAHLAVCAACREVLEDLQTIVEAAQGLPGMPPDQELWDGVSNRIGGARVARFAARAKRRFSFTLPQVAAASIALMLTSGGLVYLLRPEPPAVTATSSPGVPDVANLVMPVALVDPSYNGAVADLERRLEEGRDRLDPQTVRVLEQNLAAIDRAIDECLRALEADPANSYLNNHLVSARQRKLALLRSASALTTGS